MKQRYPTVGILTKDMLSYIDSFFTYRFSLRTLRSFQKLSNDCCVSAPILFCLACHRSFVPTSVTFTAKVFSLPYLHHWRNARTCAFQGHVQMYHEGQWNHVCEDGFTRHMADTICWDMGFERWVVKAWSRVSPRCHGVRALLRGFRERSALRPMCVCEQWLVVVCCMVVLVNTISYFNDL